MFLAYLYRLCEHKRVIFFGFGGIGLIDAVRCLLFVAFEVIFMGDVCGDESVLLVAFEEGGVGEIVVDA